VTTHLYTCRHDPMRQAYAWSERDAEMAIGCHECERECPGPDQFRDATKMIEPPSIPRELDPDGDLWDELRGAV